MTPKVVEFGERYPDDSGWQRHIEVDARLKRVSIEISGDRMSIVTEEAAWLVNAIVDAWNALGFDRLTADETPMQTEPKP